MSRDKEELSKKLGEVLQELQRLTLAQTQTCTDLTDIKEVLFGPNHTSGLVARVERTESVVNIVRWVAIVTIGPFLVAGVFAFTWLVVNHPGSLFH